MIRRFGWLLPAAAGILVVLVGAIRVIAAGSILSGDRAVLALQVADIARGNLKAVGLYSWHGWSHPGAALFYLLVPFHWLAAGQSWGVFLGMAVWSSGCVAAVAWLAFRRRGIVAASGAVTVMLLVWMASDRLAPVDPWTPYVGVTIFVVFMTAVWGVVERDRAATWIAVAAGALLVQIHVGYVPLVATIGVVAFGSYWWTGGNPRSLVRPFVTSLVLFLPWLTDPRSVIGNLGDIIDYFGSSTDPLVGVRRALEVMSSEFSPGASWIRGRRDVGIIGEAPSASPAWLIVVTLLLVLVTVSIRQAVHRRPNRQLFERLWALAPTVWVTYLVAIIATSRVKGFLFPYVVVWRPVVALIVLGWIATAVIAHLAPHRRHLLILGSIGVVAAGVLALTTVGRYDTVFDDDESVDLAIDRAFEYLDRNENLDRTGTEPGWSAVAPPVIRLRLGDAGLVGLLPAVLWRLDQAGVVVGVDDDVIWIVGERSASPGPETTVWVVCDTGYGLSLVSSAPGARLVSVVSPFAEEAERRVIELQTDIASRLRAAGRLEVLTTLDSPLVAFALADEIAAGIVDRETVEELANFNLLTPEPGYRFGIVAFAPDEVPDIWWPQEPY